MKLEHAGRTRKLSSRVRQRARLIFTPRIAGGPASQVGSNDERPAVGDVGAALRNRVAKEGVPRAISTSVRHNAQVGPGACFTPRC